MSGKRKSLGRGVEALFSDSSKEVFEHHRNEEGELVYNLDIHLIKPNAAQPRQVFDSEKIRSLSDSIAEVGLLQPITVKRNQGTYEIIAGERRWRACQMLGHKKIPAIIKDVDEATMAQLALIENLQREDLNPIEEAAAYMSLIKEYGITQEQLSKIVGKSRPFIANSMRLLNLESYLQKAIVEGAISSGHGRTLLAIEGEGRRRRIFDKIIEGDLTVRDTERLVKNYESEFTAPKKPKRGIEKSPEIKAVEEELSVHVGTRVSIRETQGRGKIEIDFYDLKDLQRILDILHP